jgi:hypothetical protein
VTEQGPGIWTVYTPGHGGVYVAPELYATMPKVLKATPYSDGGWFEEDCDWAIPRIVFDERFANHPRREESRKAAISTLRGSYDGKYFHIMLALGGLIHTGE